MRTRHTLLACLALSATLGLGACGFTPMYANTQTADTLSDFTIVTGEERVDFLLQQALIPVIAGQRLPQGAAIGHQIANHTKLAGMGSQAKADTQRTDRRRLPDRLQQLAEPLGRDVR